MKRLWITFCQAVTIAVAVIFAVATFAPDALFLRPAATFSVMEAPAAAVSAAHADGTSMAEAVKRAAPAVVSITTSKSARLARRDDPWFQFFFGQPASNELQTGLGSGVVVSPEGFILTNNHVVEGAEEIEVALTDGRRSEAKVVGTDPETDLAILKINLDKLPVIVLGSSDKLEVGDKVLAIGNPFGVGQTVTSGIVSALGRSQLGINTFENFIQTDAAINPGNSGGALVDSQGNLVGINTAIYSKSGGSMGIGFAIPVTTAKRVLETIVRKGRVTYGWIGIAPVEVTPDIAASLGVPAGRGAAITGVLKDGPAARGGVRPGDVILKVGGKEITGVADLLTSIATLPPGSPSPLVIMRQQKEQVVQVTPEVRAPRARVAGPMQE